MNCLVVGARRTNAYAAGGAELLLIGDSCGVKLLPLIRQPDREFVHSRLPQVHQQLREMRGIRGHDGGIRGGDPRGSLRLCRGLFGFWGAWQSEVFAEVPAKSALR